MPKYLVLYRSSTPAEEQMAASPEQVEAGMEAWMAWMRKAGPAVVDFGAPVGGGGDITGYSILSTSSRGELDALLAEHPHHQAPGASIEALEFLPVPGA